MVEQIIDFNEIYDMGKVLGSGSYGIVNLVTGKITRQKFALKRTMIDKININNFNKEWEVVKKLDICEEYVPKYFDRFVFVWQGVRWFCYLMEFAGDISMFDFIEKNRRLTKTIEVEDLKNIMASLLKGLKCIHKLNIVHRDIKPANIIISTPPKYVDFGFSCFTHSSKEDIKNKCTSSLKGTPRYISPEELDEQYKGDFTMTNLYKKSDIWSLGAVFFELAHNFPLIDGKNKDEIYENIRSYILNPITYQDPNIINVISLMLMRDPIDRPSIDDLLKILQLPC